MYLPRTGTTPTDSRRAQDRLAMPASIWLPDGLLMEYGGEPYARQRGAICRTASKTAFRKMNYLQRQDDKMTGKRLL